MIDLETMGLGSTAAIIQVGAVVFEPLGEGIIGQPFKQTVTMQSCIALGMTSDQGTKMFWQQRGREGKPSALHEAGLSIQETLKAFDAWYMSQEKWADLGVWSNGAVFDIPILETAYRLCGLTQPWHYRKPRDQRTLVELAQSVGWSKPDLPEPSHDALEDCIRQVAEVQGATRYVFVKCGAWEQAA